VERDSRAYLGIFRPLPFCFLKETGISGYFPQHFLYFLPLPQGQGAFLPTFGPVVLVPLA
jgi:hypothetical protein